MNIPTPSSLPRLPRGRNIARAIAHRWPALAVATVAAAVPMGVALADSFTGLTTFEAAKGIVIYVRGHDPANQALAATNDHGIGITGGGATIGVSGSSTDLGGVGVSGFSQTGTAIEAETNFGTAIKASTGTFGGTGTAIVAQANRTAGTWAAGVVALGDEAVVARGTTMGVDATANGTAVAGVSHNEVGGFFAGKEAPIRLAAAVTAGAPTSGVHHRGELYVDSNGLLFYCTADGTPGTWHQVAFKN